MNDDDDDKYEDYLRYEDYTKHQDEERWKRRIEERKK